MVLEKHLEKKFKQLVESKGGLCLKLVVLSFIGWPDRTVLMPGGVVVFLEFKKPGGVLSKQQVYWLARLNGLGFTAGAVWSVEEALEVISTAQGDQ